MRIPPRCVLVVKQKCVFQSHINLCMLPTCASEARLTAGSARIRKDRLCPDRYIYMKKCSGIRMTMYESRMFLFYILSKEGRENGERPGNSQQTIYVLLKQIYSCPCEHHEDTLGSGGIAPVIFSLGTKWG